MRAIDMEFEPSRDAEAISSGVAAEAIGEALQKVLEPIAMEPLPRRMIDALGALEDADDWGWVRS